MKEKKLNDISLIYLDFIVDWYKTNISTLYHGLILDSQACS